jgi:aarF domain-containing kinase
VVIVRIGWQRVGEMAEEMKKMRAQMEEDEQLASLMRGLRGQNLSDDLFASADTQLRLVEVTVNLFPYLVM